MTEQVEGQNAKDPAMWSRAFAQKIGALLGLPASEIPPSEASLREATTTLLGEMTEDIRHLRGEQWNWIEHLSRFLIDREADPGQVNQDQAALWVLGRPLSPRLELLHEVRSYAAFLRIKYGFERPADESDEWTDEDRHDCQLAAWRRLDDEDPYPWSEAADDANAGCDWKEIQA